MSIIDVRELSKRFGRFTAVDRVTFTVEKGEIFGFLGPNGAGKTTTIRMLCTLLRPTGGNATVAGFDIVKQANKVRQHIGLVAEKIILYDQLTPSENLTLFGRLNNLPASEITSGIERWLGRLHMEQWKDKQVGTFSTGMKQRINIARALLHRPSVVFLDEPTLGLDPQTTRFIHDFILELSQEGTTVVLTTHGMGEADTLSHRIAIIDRGGVVASGTPAELKNLVSNNDSGMIDMEIPNLNEAMLARLKQMQVVASVVETDAHHIRVRTKGAEAPGPIVNAISAEGGQIRSINTAEPNLEDVFLHFTGREMRDAASGKVTSVRGPVLGSGTSRAR
ncbi:MAG: ATP-binding cassette domain-containing protein [Dehalococcoidia bacterium]|nr:ATP-binding cassette domain-containing protein [Dehalococcoidia bacterium]